MGFFTPTAWQSMSNDELCRSIQSIGRKKVKEARKRVEEIPAKEKREKKRKEVLSGIKQLPTTKPDLVSAFREKLHSFLTGEKR